MNAINDWIRAANTPKGKDKRRITVAIGCLIGAALCLLAFPYGLIGTVPLAIIGIVKLKNAAVDDT
jgi:hypothetical protein